MTKQEFFEAFYKKYPYSCMTIKDMENIIESYPEDTMPFKIEDEWSWRGIYDQACIGISIEETSKQDNLKELSNLLKYPFDGWKGGEFSYEESTLIHFENSWGEATTFDEDSCYFVQFIKNNEDNPFIQHMIEYFVNDKHNEVEYYQDIQGHDIQSGMKVAYYDDTNERLSIGYVIELNKNERFVKVINVPVYLYKDDTPTVELTFNKIVIISDDL